MIGIIAPILDDKKASANLDFALKLKNDDRELTLNCLFELAKNHFDTMSVSQLYSYSHETIPAAGYYLSSLLRSAGYDTTLVPNTDDDSLRALAASTSLAVCISSTMIFERAALKRMIDRIRKVMPDTIIIVGGVMVWKSYNLFLAMKEDKLGLVSNLNNNKFSIFPCNKSEINADIFVVSPHGGPTLIRLLKEIAKGKKAELDHIDNLAIPDSSGDFYFTKRSGEVIDINEDFTRWDLLDELPGRISIRTSIGCPYRCGFCDFCYLYPTLSFRSYESLSSELKMIGKILPSHQEAFMIHFTDDNIFINANRASEVCRAIIESKISLPWASFMRASSVNESNIDLMKRSGLIYSYVGVESGDSTILLNMKKGQKIEEMRKGIELIDNSGITVQMTFLVGYPGETEESILSTIEFIETLSVNMTNYQLYPLYITPLSPLSTLEMREQWEISGNWDKWSHKTMNFDEAVKYCCKIFKAVRHVPYHYPEESHIFNLRFSKNQRERLYDLRRLLTLQVIEKKPGFFMKQTLKSITGTMGFGKVIPPSDFGDNLYTNYTSMQ